MTDRYDCIVLGGGPAGSTVATLVATAGFSTLLVERERVPRFRMGETLLPEANSVLARLGVLDRLKASHFPHNRGVRFLNHAGRLVQSFAFADRKDLGLDHGWHVVRSEFDEMLWRGAAERGADCRDRSRVVGVVFDGQRAVGVDVQTADGATERFVGQVIVDATGSQAILASQLGLRSPDAGLRKSAIWGYYENARRDPDLDVSMTLVFQTKSRKAWFWYVGLPHNTVSIGLVADTEYLLKGRGKPASVFEEELVNCPAVLERLVDARLICEFRVHSQFAYTSRRAAGDGWVLVGDALAALDPMDSAGVSLALKSGELAGDAIVAALTSGDMSGQALAGWAADYFHGLGQLRQLVDAFYCQAFSFGAFAAVYPQHQQALVELLSGKFLGVRATSLFTDLEAWLEQARAAADQQGRA